MILKGICVFILVLYGFWTTESNIISKIKVSGNATKVVFALHVFVHVDICKHECTFTQLLHEHIVLSVYFERKSRLKLGKFGYDFRQLLISLKKCLIWTLQPVPEEYKSNTKMDTIFKNNSRQTMQMYKIIIKTVFTTYTMFAIRQNTAVISMVFASIS